MVIGDGLGDGLNVCAVSNEVLVLYTPNFLGRGGWISSLSFLVGVFSSLECFFFLCRYSRFYVFFGENVMRDPKFFGLVHP
jgi:hypothetical protein